MDRLMSWAEDAPSTVRYYTRPSRCFIELENGVKCIVDTALMFGEVYYPTGAYVTVRGVSLTELSETLMNILVFAQYKEY